MGNKLPIILIVLAAIVLGVFSSVYVVNERDQAIVVRFGEIQAVRTEPGLYFKLPFGFLGADRVQIVEDRAMRFDLDDIRVQVSGGKFYDVDALSFTGSRIPSGSARRSRATSWRPSSVCARVSIPRFAGYTVCAASRRLFPKSANR